jgi:molecular chaperone GrpE (heat shock protein)
MPDQNQSSATAETVGSANESRLSTTELKELLRRECPRLHNHTRRVTRDRVAGRPRALDEVAGQLLPFLETFEWALAEVPEDLVTHPWAQTIAHAYGELVEALARLDIEFVWAAGEERTGVRDRWVLRVVRHAHRRRADLIRPSRAGRPSRRG